MGTYTAAVAISHYMREMIVNYTKLNNNTATYGFRRKWFLYKKI